MLRPAQLYKDELLKKHYEQWYKPETSYYSGSCNWGLRLEESDEYKRQFVSVDKNNNVIGYIAYNVDFLTRSASCFGMISYSKGNLDFVKDLYKVIKDLFMMEKFNRVEWWCFTDNPAVRGYKNFCKRFGGKIVGTLHNTCMFSDGSLHDSYIFEILREDLKFKDGENNNV